jgi:hypothetical protein
VELPLWVRTPNQFSEGRAVEAWAQVAAEAAGNDVAAAAAAALIARINARAAASAAAMKIHDLWIDQTANGNMLRKYSRQINNALALASQVVKHTDAPAGHGGWSPSIVIQGKLCHKFPALQTVDGRQPRFAQVYVLDSAMETEVRVKNLMLPKSVTPSEIAVCHGLLNRMQGLLRLCNPYVQDFISLNEMPEDQISLGKYILNAQAKPAHEHE